MKRLSWLIGIVASCTTLLMGSLALGQSDPNFWSERYQSPTPEWVLDLVVDRADSDVIGTELDGVSNFLWPFGEQYKVANTLDSVRVRIAVYLQWIVFIGLVVAVILIIFNGYILVTSPLSGADLSKVKGKLTNLAIWVLVMTGFYFIIKIALSVMLQVTW